MTSFAETKFIPACRTQLARYARWENAGHLDRWTDESLAVRLRLLAPTLADLTTTAVLDVFAVLCDEVAELDALGDPIMRLALGDAEAEADAAQLRVDCTLAALVPGEAL
jgi:phage tail tape-measure protein